MADEAVIVDKIGTIFLGGPPLVKVLQSVQYFISQDIYYFDLQKLVLIKYFFLLKHYQVFSQHYFKGMMF